MRSSAEQTFKKFYSHTLFVIATLGSKHLVVYDEDFKNDVVFI